MKTCPRSSRRVEHFEDIEAWQLAHELTRKYTTPVEKLTVNREPANLSSYLKRLVAPHVDDTA